MGCRLKTPIHVNLIVCISCCFCSCKSISNNIAFWISKVCIHTTIVFTHPTVSCSCFCYGSFVSINNECMSNIFCLIPYIPMY